VALRLIWSENGLRDLDLIAAYVAVNSPQNAKAITRRAFARADLLPDHPRQGRRLPENRTARDIREVFVHRWRLIYEVTPATVVILAVLHGARLIDDVDL
jgi:toxin ParE1/3/4